MIFNLIGLQYVALCCIVLHCVAAYQYDDDSDRFETDKVVPISTIININKNHSSFLFWLPHHVARHQCVGHDYICTVIYTFICV